MAGQKKKPAKKAAAKKSSKKAAAKKASPGSKKKVVKKKDAGVSEEAAMKKKAVVTEKAAGDAPTPGTPTMPMFYKQPAALNPIRHQGKGLREGAPDYSFAAASNSIPINAAEFGLAMKHYPIVFSESSPAIPAVVVGLEEGQNLFVDKKGRWREDVYIPAYVRRYPFVFVTSEEQEKYILCIDEESNQIVKGGQPFFGKDGKSDKILETALEFCSTYQKQYVMTQQMGEAMAKLEILVPNRADIQMETGARLGMTGFRMIEEKKFNSLDDTAFLEIRKQGWLPAVYLHLISQSNWTGLVRMWSDENEKKK